MMSKMDAFGLCVLACCVKFDMETQYTVNTV